jgi:hypothetical protein
MANVDTNTLCYEGKNLSLLKKNHSDSTNKFYETDIINMFEFLIDNIFAMFGGQSVYLAGANCAPLLTDFFLY